MNERQIGGPGTCVQQPRPFCISHLQPDTPRKLVAAALAMIDALGYVAYYSVDDDELIEWAPNRPQRLDDVPTDVYKYTVFEVARRVYYHVRDGGQFDTTMHQWIFPEATLAALAHYLTGFRHQPRIIEQALQIIKITETGLCYAPRYDDIVM